MNNASAFLFKKLEKGYCEHRYFPKQVNFRKEDSKKLRMESLISLKLFIIEHNLESILYSPGCKTPQFENHRVDSKLA